MEALTTAGTAGSLRPARMVGWGGAQPRRRMSDSAPELLPRLPDAILQRVLVALCVVDQQLKVVYANDAAKTEIQDSDCLAVFEHTLHARPNAVHAKLRKAVEGARTGRWALLHLGSESRTTSVAVVPIGEPGHALLVFGLRCLSHDLAISFFLQAHSMTTAEGRVLRGLVGGLSPRQIAGDHGVALSTVRSQILRIRERTRTQSIRDLVQAVGRLPPVMPAIKPGA